MIGDIERAKELLETEDCTLAAVRISEVMTSRERGVKPLLGMIDRHESLGGFAVADKVIGKAAALIYVLLDPVELYAGVISRPALSVIENAGIPIAYGTLTDAVRNRDNSGFCPMETAVMDTDDPEEAITLIRRKLAELNSK